MKTMLLSFFLVACSALSIQAQGWQTDFDQAQQQATEEDKKVLLVFSGSDWCAPCIKLKKEILATPEFLQSAWEEYELVNADFPRRKKNALPEALTFRNKALAERYNKEGHFPLVVVLTADGTVLGKTGYHKTTPEGYFDLLNTFSK